MKAAVKVGLGLVLLYLAARACESFARYGLRSKVVEAKTNLMGIRRALEDFAKDQHFVPTLPPTPPRRDGWAVKARWDAAACAKECSAATKGACGSFECIGYRPAGDVYYEYACIAVEDDFTCAARGDLDADGRFGLFVIGTNRRQPGGPIVAPIPDMGVPHACATPPPAGEVADCSTWRSWFERWILLEADRLL